MGFNIGTNGFERNGKSGTWYHCTDCGCIYGNGCKKNTMRPNNKFCDRDCMAYVLENNLQTCGRRPAGWRDWIKAHDEDTTL